MNLQNDNRGHYSGFQLDAFWGRGRPARKTATETVALPGKKNTFNCKPLYQQLRKEDRRMQWHLLIGSTLLCGVVGIGIWSYAYRLGLKHGQATSVPFRVIDELLDHKIHCLGQDPAFARIELETSLHIASWELQSLTQHVLQVPRNQKDEVTLAAHGHSAEVSSIP